GDTRALAAALYARYYLGSGDPARAPEMLANVDRLAALGSAAGPQLAVLGHAARLSIGLQLGDRAIAEAEAAVLATRASGASRHWSVVLLLMDGRFAEAEEIVERLQRSPDPVVRA